MAPLGQGVALRQALEVRARHVVEQQVVGQLEKLPESLHQVPLDGFLVGQETIQGSIQPRGIDLRVRQPEQILERRAAIPVLRDVELARRLTQARDHQHGRHLRPRHGLPPRPQHFLAQHVEPQRAPQRPSQPHVPKCTAALETKPLQTNRNDRVLAAPLLEQLPLVAPPRDLACQGLRLGPPLRVQLPELRHRLLHDLPVATNGTDQPPVDVRLAVLADLRVAQVHAAPPLLTGRIPRTGPPAQGTWLALHANLDTSVTQFHALARPTPLNFLQISLELAKLG